MGLAENAKEHRSRERVPVVASRPVERVGGDLHGSVELAAEHQRLGRPRVDQHERVGVVGLLERAPGLVELRKRRCEPSPPGIEQCGLDERLGHIGRAARGPACALCLAEQGLGLVESSLRGQDLARH